MIYLGADFRGFDLLQKIKGWLREWGEEFEDLSPEKKEGDDYVDHAALVAKKVAGKKGALGILACGTGAGMDIAANKVIGVRSCLGLSPEQARRVRITDHTNLLSIPAEYLSERKVRKMIRFFLEAEPSTEARYLRRVEKVAQLEKAK